VLSGIFNSVFQDLVYPFYQNPDIIGQSQYDTSGLTDLAQLEADMRNIYQELLMQRLLICAYKEIQLVARGI
jgi:hypothetical protein